MKKLFTIFFSLYFTTFMFAQKMNITGKVTDIKTGEPITGVQITVRPKGENKIKYYAITSSDGEYEIKNIVFSENDQLHFSMMGYATEVIQLSPNRIQYNIRMSEKATNLKEVIVKAPGIHEKGDTITYIVSKFADIQDKTLADVLKKMPGIDVEKSGEIKYNGVAINKFYIEGHDMLEGRYGLATNNIHQKDVGSVEVMENHQPIKALEDISFSQNPAINIHLKKDAKARWVGSARLATGFSPWLWNAQFTAMRFKQKTQTLDTYKTNNTGGNVLGEAQDFSVDLMSRLFSNDYDLRTFVDISPDEADGLNDSRTTFNRTHLLTSNNLWTVAKDYDLTAQITYINNKKTANSSEITTYYLNEGTIVNEEDQSSSLRQNHVMADLTLTGNRPKFYIKNKLETDLNLNDMAVDLSGTYSNTQTANIRHFQVSDDLSIIKRFDKKALSVSSYNLYQTKPQMLSVANDSISQSQNIQASVFYTNTFTNFSFYLQPFTVSAKTGIVGITRQLQSNLSGIPDSLGSLLNRLSIRYLQLYVSPEMAYKKNKFEGKLAIPFSLTPYGFKDLETLQKDNILKFFISPRVNLQYFITSRFKMSLAASISQNQVKEQQFYDGLILNNYQTITQGLVDYHTGSYKSLNLSMTYRVPLKTFFSNASLTRSWNNTPYSSNRSFVGDYIMQTIILQNHNSDMWMAYGSVSKGINGLKNIVSLQTSYTVYNGSMYQNDILTPYQSNVINITTKIKSKITSWSNISYEINYANNAFTLKNSETKNSLNSLSQNILWTIYPNKSWYIKLTGEHYLNEIVKGTTKQLFLADAEFTYSFKNGWEVNLSAKNIFNQQQYDYTIYDGLSSYNRSYTIRPRNIMAGVFFRF